MDEEKLSYSYKFISRMGHYEETKYFDVPFCRVDKEYLSSDPPWTIESKSENCDRTIKSGPNITPISQIRVRTKYPNKLLKQLQNIGVEFDEKSGVERITDSVPENKLAQVPSDIDLEGIADETLQALSESMDEVEDSTLSGWDPMKKSFEQKSFNTYQVPRHDDNFLEEHVPVRRMVLLIPQRHCLCPYFYIPGLTMLVQICQHSTTKSTFLTVPHVELVSLDGYKISPTKLGAEDVKLYVSNIPMSLTEEGMKNLFSSVGTCKDIKRCRPKEANNLTTFGFVTYQSVREAEAAIQKYNNFSFGVNQCKLQVRLAYQKSHNTQDKNNHENIHWGGTTSGSGGNFSESGDDVVKPSQSKIVPAKNKEEPATLPTPSLGSNNGELTPVVTENKSPNQKPRLYVQGLAVGTSDIELKRLFDACGSTHNCIVTPAKKPNQNTTYGFVSYDSLEEANAAVERFHNYQHGGKMLSVTFSNQSAAEYGRRMRMNEDELFYEQLYNKDPFKDETIIKSAVISENDKVTPPRKMGEKQTSNDVCVYCLSPGATKKCSRCQSPYCNRECQSHDWHAHKVTCEYATTTSPISSLLTSPGKVTKAAYVDDLPLRECFKGDMSLLFAVFHTDLSVSGIVVCADQRYYVDALVAMETSFMQYNDRKGNVVLNDVAVGLLVVTKFTEIDWGRCVVTSTPLMCDLNFDVYVDLHFIDNGLNERKQIKDLFYLTSENMFLPKQEGHFVLRGLENVEELSSHKTVANTLTSFVEGKPLSVTFAEEQNSFVYIKVGEENINEYILNNFIENIKMNRHSVPSTISRQPSCSDAIRGMMLSNLEPQPYPDQAEFQLCVTEIVSPVLFYGQLLHDQALQGLQNVTEMLHTTYEDMTASAAFTPKINEVCVAKFSDGCWYRASVVQYDTDMKTAIEVALWCANVLFQAMDYIGYTYTVVIEENLMKYGGSHTGSDCLHEFFMPLWNFYPFSGQVFFIDFGNKADVATLDLRCINETLLNYPRYAVRFGLNVTQPKSNFWSTDIIEVMKASLLDTISKIRCVNVQGDTMICDVLLEDTSLVKTIQSKIQKHTKRVMLSELPAQTPMDVNKEYHTIVVNAESPNEFHAYVGDLVSITRDVQEITTALAECTDVGTSYTPLVGEVCAAYYEEFQEWYRVVVLNVGSGSLAIQLIDYGFKLDVKPHHVCQLPANDKRFEVSAQAISMSLFGVKSAQNSWDEAAIKLFKESVEYKKSVCTRVNSAIDPMQVSLISENGECIKDLFIREKHIISATSDNAPVHVEQVKKCFAVELPCYQPTKEKFDVVVTYIKDPWLFYGQVAAEKNITDLNAITTVLSELGSVSSHQGYKPEVEEIVVGFAESYGEWYRMLVVSLSKSDAIVFLLDYGESMSIELAHLLPLPVAISMLPAQAVSFSMHNVTPCSGVMWNAAAISKFTDLVLYKRISAQKVTMEDDVIKIKAAIDGTDIADTLISNSLAISSSSPQAFTQRPPVDALVVPVSRTMNSDIPKLRLPSEQTTVLVVNIMSPHKFHCQLGQIENLQQLDELTNAMTSDFTKDDTDEYKPVIGEICAGFFSEFEQYFRVKVNLVVDNTVHVSSIDYGNDDVINFTDIRPLPKKYANLAQQSFQMSLYNSASSAADNKWTDNCVVYFNENCLNQKCYCVVKEHVGDIYHVELATDTITNLHQDLIRHGFAVASQLTAVDGEAVKTSFLQSAVNTVKANSEKADSKLHQQVTSELAKKTKYYAADLQCFKPSEEEFDTVLSYIKDPSLFYGQVACAKNLTDLNSITKILSELGSASVHGVYTPDLNEIVVGFAESYGEWYRMLVVSLSNSAAHVFLLDYGESLTIELTHLQPLPNAISTVPAQAVAFGLNGIAPISGVVWDAAAISKFNELAIYKRISAQKVIMENDIMKIKAAIDGMDIADTLISISLAISSSSPQAFTQRPPIDALVVPVLHERTMNSDIPKLRLPSEQSTVFVVNIMSPHKFHCQLGQIENLQQLDELTNAMTSDFTKDDTDEYKPVIGEICAGFFSEFEQYFRVKVNLVVDNTVHVSSIDYGNDDVINFTDIRPLPMKYANLAQQSFQMSLYNSASSAVDDKWTDDCVVYFNEKCLNQKCYCVVKEHVDDIYYVELASDTIADLHQDFIMRGYAIGSQRTVENDKPLELSMLQLPVDNASPVNTTNEEVDPYTRLPKQTVPNECQMTISHAESIDKFFALLGIQETAAAMYNLTEKMCLYCSEHTLKLYKPCVGELCCGFDGECWYRAYVKEVTCEHALVVFIDYGNEQKLNFENLRPILEKFKNLPSLAVQLSLHNPNSVPNSPAVFKYFMEMTTNKLLPMKVIDKCSSFLVQIMDEDGEDLMKGLESAWNKEVTDEKTSTMTVLSVNEEKPEVPINEPQKEVTDVKTSTTTVLSINEKKPSQQSSEPIREQKPTPKTSQRASLPLTEPKQDGSLSKAISDHNSTNRLNQNIPIENATITEKSSSVVTPKVGDADDDDLDEEIALISDAKYEPVRTAKMNIEKSSYLPQNIPCDERGKKLETTTLTNSKTFTISRLPTNVHALESVGMKMSVAFLSSQPTLLCVKHIVSPHLIYAVLADAQSLEEVENISKELAEQSSSVAAPHAKSGLLCAVQDEQKNWCRAVVKSVEAEECVVFAIDHGFTMTKPHNELRPLSRKLQKLPAQAIPLKLMTVKPKDSSTEWSDEAVEYFKGIVDGETIKVLPKFKEGVVMNVKMKIASTNEGVDKLFEEYAIIFKPIVPKEIEEYSKPPQVLRGVPFETVLQLIKMQAAPKTGPFKAIVTCAVSPRLFYVQLYNEARIAKVDEISDKLKDLYEHTTDCDNVFTSGQLCAVKYHDDYWYRAFILEARVNETLVLWLIDYGMKDYVVLKNVRPLPDDMKALPAQAVTMQLQYITPCGNASNYSQKAVQRFKSITEGKLMNFNVVKVHGVINRVNMHDSSSGMDISEQLVDEGLAEYIFGKNTHPRRGSPSRRGLPIPGRDMVRGALRGLHGSSFRGTARDSLPQRPIRDDDRQYYVDRYNEAFYDDRYGEFDTYYQERRPPIMHRGRPPLRGITRYENMESGRRSRSSSGSSGGGIHNGFANGVDNQKIVRDNETPQRSGSQGSNRGGRPTSNETSPTLNGKHSPKRDTHPERHFDRHNGLYEDRHYDPNHGNQHQHRYDDGYYNNQYDEYYLDRYRMPYYDDYYERRYRDRRYREPEGEYFHTQRHQEPRRMVPRGCSSNRGASSRHHRGKF